MAQTGKSLPVIQAEFNPWVGGMATHPSVLAWRILWTGEPATGYSPWGLKELYTTERLSLS